MIRTKLEARRELTMSRAQRLRTAVEAERLADWVRVSHLDYTVRWRKGEAILMVLSRSNDGWTPCTLGRFCYADQPLADPLPTRDAAIRAGLIALAEREESIGS